MIHRIGISIILGIAILLTFLVIVPLRPVMAFFPLGIYRAQVVKDGLRLAKEKGFNTAVVPAEVSWADKLHALGLKGVFFFAFQKEIGMEPKRWERFNARLKQVISRLKDHPAVLAWYVVDEPDGQGIPVETFCRLYRQVKTWDSKHPFFAVFNVPGRWHRYFPCTDVVGLEPYLVRRGGGYEGPEVVTRQIRRARYDLNRLSLSKQIWVVLQAFEYRYEEAGVPPPFKVPITPIDLEEMFIRALREGVDGVFLYALAWEAGVNPVTKKGYQAWNLLQDRPKLWGFLGDFLGRWEELRRTLAK